MTDMMKSLSSPLYCTVLCVYQGEGVNSGLEDVGLLYELMLREREGGERIDSTIRLHVDTAVTAAAAAAAAAAKSSAAAEPEAKATGKEASSSLINLAAEAEGEGLFSQFNSHRLPDVQALSRFALYLNESMAATGAEAASRLGFTIAQSVLKAGGLLAHTSEDLTFGPQALRRTSYREIVRHLEARRRVILPCCQCCCYSSIGLYTICTLPCWFPCWLKRSLSFPEVCLLQSSLVYSSVLYY